MYITFQEEASRKACLEDQPTSIIKRLMMPREQRFREEVSLLVEE